MPVLKTINLISRRLILPGFRSEPYMHVSDLERAIQISGNDEALMEQEQTVLQNIVQLSEIRIDEWMRPRTQFQTYQPPVKLADLAGKIPPSGYVLITEADSQEIEKAIRLDNQYHLPDDELERFGDPVLYLPWCSTVADALEKMSHRDREVTVIVNEYGDTIGILTIEDILETVFTYEPSRSKRLLNLNPLHEIEPGKWVASGMMSLRQLSRALERQIPETTCVTIGGIIQETVQRLAEKGDEVDWGEFHFVVLEAPERGNMLVELTFAKSAGG
jgi:CBS domain containing-hemolysin-like protein